VRALEDMASVIENLAWAVRDGIVGRGMIRPKIARHFKPGPSQRTPTTPGPSHMAKKAVIPTGIERAVR